jgi:hypothetical protein
LDDHDPRFGMLETIREFGLEELASKGELEAAREAHARYVLRLAEQAESELEGPGQGAWIDRLEEEHRNLNAALACALDTQNGELGLKMTGALWPFWEVRGYFGEGRTWTERMLTLDGPPALRARTLTGAGTMAWYQGDYERAHTLHDEALAIYHEIGDGRGIAFAQVSLGVQAARPVSRRSPPWPTKASEPSVRMTCPHRLFRLLPTRSELDALASPRTVFEVGHPADVDALAIVHHEVSTAGPYELAGVALTGRGRRDVAFVPVETLRLQESGSLPK